MILLVSGIERRAEFASAIEEAMGESVVIAGSLLRATTLLRTEMYTVAVFDEQLWPGEADEIETALSHLGAAIPVAVNLGISGRERLVREVRAAVRWRKHEEASAREAAARSLRGELNGTLTTLLLDCELVLGTSDLPAGTAARLTSLHGAAQKLRMQLGATSL
jgi:hypothetical protein